jgi:hypothetical protein
MARYEDLSPCDYFGPQCTPFLRAVGWLECEQPFATGRVDAEVFKRLVEMCKNPWQPGFFMGFHPCDLCLYEGRAGKRNVFIPASGVVFVCPELITHYMNEHGYRPPDEFCAAVLACPPMRSMPYFKALLASGGKPLIGQVTEADITGTEGSS